MDNINRLKNTISPEVKMAVDHIELVKQEVNQMGANDSEIPSLNQLIYLLKNNQIKPEEAKRIADSIKYRKNDYH